MNRIIYSKPDGTITIVTPIVKSSIEKVLGPLTDEQYADHVISRSIPSDAINVRYIEDSDIPESREFRDAWTDITADSKIDICLEKAKEVKLKEMRLKRDKLLEEVDKEFIIALEKGEDTSEIKSRKQSLRDSTEGLKSLDVTGKVNDLTLLEEIKKLGEER